MAKISAYDLAAPITGDEQLIAVQTGGNVRVPVKRIKGLTTVFITSADSPYTASEGEAIFCNTSGGAIIINLPAGINKDRVAVYGDATSGTNNITIVPNGSETIDPQGDTSFVIDQAFASAMLGYEATGTVWRNSITGTPEVININTIVLSKVISATSYTILEEDNGYVLVFTAGSAIAVTQPDTLSTPFQYTVLQAGAGVPTVTRVGTETINGAATGVTPAAQHKGMYMLKYAAGTWEALK